MHPGNNGVGEARLREGFPSPDACTCGLESGLVDENPELQRHSQGWGQGLLDPEVAMPKDPFRW